MKHIVNFSGGDCSFWSAFRVIEKYGTQDVVLLFADTKIEDEDLYEFIDKAAAFLGVPLIKISDGRDPWQLFEDEGLIGNNHAPICSIRLKREMLDKWMRVNCLEMDTTIYVGFDFTEYNRLEDLRRELSPWKVEAPMCDEPLWDKCRIIAETRKLGFKMPKLYEMGFPHNNCGGCCVRAGFAHWQHLHKMLPARYQEWEEKEERLMVVLASRGITPLTILKDRRGNETNNLSLKALRLRIEAGEDFSKRGWGGCGCGGAKSPTEPLSGVTI